MSDDYAKQYLGTFPPPDKMLHDLAREYHERCEAYDRTVCTGPIGPGGGILPATSRESALISKNAAEVRADVLRKAERHGRQRADVIRAIQNYDDPVATDPTPAELK